MATYELSLVRKKTSSREEPPVITSRNAVDYLLRNCYEPEQMSREVAWAVMLDNQNRPIGHYLAGVGTKDSTTIDKAGIIATALLTQARSIVLCHNHLTTNVNPSQNDIKMTEDLKKAFSVFGLLMLDHIIIGEGKYFSYQDEVERVFD